MQFDKGLVNQRYYYVFTGLQLALLCIHVILKCKISKLLELFLLFYQYYFISI